jgi:hypothetical protein
MAKFDVSTLTPGYRALGSTCILPTTRYAVQEDDEQMLLLLRAHPVTQITWVLNTVIGVVLVWLCSGILFQYASTRIGIYTLIIVTSIICAYAWHNFLLWYYNVGIVSTKRIVDIDFYGVSKRVTTEASVTKIVEATSRVAGFTGQIFNYGDVEVKTEGPIQNIEFYKVADPDLVVNIINSTLESSSR